MVLEHSHNVQDPQDLEHVDHGEDGEALRIMSMCNVHDKIDKKELYL
jgi:hypothetical protein